jgi:hypothetical protein
VKYLVLALLAGAAAWFYLIDGTRLDEGMVREFYAQQARHTYERDPEALCKQIGGKYQMHIQSRIAGKVTDARYGKSAACEQLRQSFKFFEDIGERADGILTIEYSYDIRKLDLSPNNRSATVEIATTLKMGEELMQIFSESTDRIERSMRQVVLVAQDSSVRMRWTPGAIAHPEEYFKAQ